MKAKQFINYCLKEYEDLGQEKANIIKTISGLDAGDENQAALLDRIWKLLNSETFGNNITNAFVATTQDEYMQAATLDGHRKNVAEIISRLDSDYGALNGFLKKLEGGGAVNIAELSKPVNTFNSVFEGDAVAIKAFDALKGYGVGEKQKGPGEFALAMMSNKIRLAQGEGDTEIDGIGKVEVKAAMGSKGSGGRLGHGGPSQENQLKVLEKYEERIPNMLAGIRAKAGGTIGIGPFVNGLNAELPAGQGDNSAIRQQMVSELLTPTFGNFANNIAKAFQGEDRTAIENAGGFQEFADKSKIYVIKANGTIEKPSRNIFSGNARLEPGDTVVVPRKFNTNNPVLQSLLPVSSLLSDLAFSAAALDNLSN